MDLFSFSYLFSIWMFVKGIFDFHKSRRTAFELSKDKIDTFREDVKYQYYWKYVLLKSL